MPPLWVARMPGVLLFLLLTLGGCSLKAQTAVFAGGETVAVDYLAGLKGVAFCRDEGSVAFVRVGMTHLETAMVTVHEAKHLSQYARFPNCKAAMRAYRTPKGMLEMEAEAFAAGWCLAGRAGADTVALRSELLWLLAVSYVPGTSIYDISQVFKKYEDCGDAR